VTSYYYYDVPSNSFIAYDEPESTVESTYYETFDYETSTIHGANIASTAPTLYYYKEATNTYYEIEPTPLVSTYYYYNDNTNTFETYPKAITYDNVYAYDEASESYYTVSEPVDSIRSYYNYNDRTESFVPVVPTCPLDESVLLPPKPKEYTVDYYTTSPDENSLYFYDYGTQNFYYISEPTESVERYYSYNPETGNFY
jgi:hypothetical protein